MKIIYGKDLKNYGIIRSDEKEKSELRFLLDKEVNKGSLQDIKNYSDCDGLNAIFSNLNRKWGMILECLDNQPQGKRLLDIGCGSNKDTIESNLEYSYKFEPWLLRFLYSIKNKTNLNAFGIDIGDLSEEEFPYLQLNILDKNSLTDNFKPNTFDIITAFKLFNSPELEKRYSGKKVINARLRTSKKIREKLIPQLENILKPDGTFLWTDHDY